MITKEHIKTSLGEKFDASVEYRIVEKGSGLVSMLAQGYGNCGKLDDNFSAGNTEIFILSPPIPKVVVPLQQHFRPPKRVPPPPPTPPPVVAKPQPEPKPEPKRTPRMSHETVVEKIKRYKGSKKR